MNKKSLKKGRPVPPELDAATGLPKAYVERAQRQLAAQTESNDVVLPGPLREAFADGRRQVGVHMLLPVTLGLAAILDQIQSPLLQVIKIMREEMSGPEDATIGAAKAHELRLAKATARMAKEIKADDAANVETVFCFLTPPAELRALLARGREAFREAAMATLGDTLHPVILAQLQQAVAGHYCASYATVIQHGAKPKEGEVFSKPPAARTTASAGGSIS